MRTLAAIVLVSVVLPGCAQRNNYFVNRGADLSDVLRAHVMFGPGIGLKGEATRLLHLGGTYTKSSFAAGFHDRQAGAWRESIRSWGLVVGHHDEEVEGTSQGYPLERISGNYGWVFTERGTSFQPATGQLDLDLLTLRGTLMLIVGVDVEIRLGEVLDFLAGIFQFDPARDDRDYEHMRVPGEVEPPEELAPAADEADELPAVLPDADDAGAP